MHMPTYTVHAPPPKKGETASAPERFRFVRDGFHFWAFLLTPVWLLVNRLWLALLTYIVLYALLEAGLVLLRAPSNVQFVVGVLIALLMGFEASSIQRWTWSRRGWKQLGFIVAEDEEIAEQRFFAAWTKEPAPAAEAPPSPPAPTYTAPLRRGPSTGHDVIGLFPEPGNPR
jgi:hypothetical protein